MGFGSFIFGDPERKRRKNREDLDRDYYTRRKAYLEAKEKQRIQNAKNTGIQDANRLANQQPFYKRVMGAGQWLVKDLAGGASKTNPNVLFSWDNEKVKRKRKRRKK